MASLAHQIHQALNAIVAIMVLRDYQQRAIDQLYLWLANNTGNPCLEMPTGSGKSHVIAELCRDAVQRWPETRILMLTHVRELIEQNAAKLRKHWPNAPLGIYSAGLRQRELSEPITFAGIQSVRKRHDEIGHVDLVIVDECHLISHKDEGGYRSLISSLQSINPALRVIGLTATPYRLGHGLITDKPAIFDGLIRPVTIEELICKEYLSPLRSKLTSLKLSVSGVRKRGGEYIDSQLQKAVDTEAQTRPAVDELVERGANRKGWLVFCAGVEHAEHVRDAIRERGATAEMVLGTTPAKERDEILSAFKRGEIRALTNANVLTTGFDYPDIDLIALLRPTMSPALYVQMAGRGMRPKSHAPDCLVLDFAGVVQQHGPITCVTPPEPGGDGTGEAPTKTCPQCQELCHAAVRECPSCGFGFPPPQRTEESLRNDDIMGNEGREVRVTGWEWRVHTGHRSGIRMLVVDYMCGDIGAPISEYLTIIHGGWAGAKARRVLASIANQAGSGVSPMADLPDIAESMNAAKPPLVIEVIRDGRYNRVTARHWAGQLEIAI